MSAQPLPVPLPILDNASVELHAPVLAQVILESSRAEPITASFAARLLWRLFPVNRAPASPIPIEILFISLHVERLIPPNVHQ